MSDTVLLHPHFVTLPGNIEIAYTDDGAGDETILFVHGLSSNLLIWSPNISVFKSHYRCIALDLPGHGASSKEKYPYTIDFFLDILQQFLKQLEIKSCVLVGHSMGGQISIAAAVKFPNLFSKLILAGPAGFEQFTRIERNLMSGYYLQHVLQSPLYKKMISSVIKARDLPKPFGSPDMAEKYGFFPGEIPKLKSEQYLGLCIKGMLEHQAHFLLHQILQPTLVIFGKEDRLIPNRMFHHMTTEDVAREGASHIHNCKLILFDDCGHYVQHEKPEEFNVAVYQFLNPEG